MEINLQVRHGLACVEDEHRSNLMGAADNRRDISDGTRGVAHMGDCDDFRAFVDDLVGGIGTDASVIGQIEPFEGCPGTVRKLLERQKHGMMFRLGNHDFITRLQRETLSRLAAATETRIAECGRQQVQSGGRAGGDDNLLFALRAVGADQTRYLRTRLFERHRAACRQLMGSAVDARVDGSIELAFGIDDALRLLRCRSGIEIYQRVTVDALIQNRELFSDSGEINICHVQPAFFSGQR